MERKDLLEANGGFTAGRGAERPRQPQRQGAGGRQPGQHQRLHRHEVRPDLPAKNFTAMLRPGPQPRPVAMAAKTGKAVADVENMAVVGQPQPDHVPDYRFATIGGESVKQMINDDVEQRRVPADRRQARRRHHRSRGLSSAASAANAAIDHIRDWALGTNGKWVTMGIPSDGSYGIPEGVMFGFRRPAPMANTPLCKAWKSAEFSRGRINVTPNELEEERAGVAHLLG